MKNKYFIYILVINLATPILNVLYLKYATGYIKLLTNKTIKELKRIIYCKSFISVKYKGEIIHITGGEALKYLLKKIDLILFCVYNHNNLVVYIL